MSKFSFFAYTLVHIFIRTRQSVICLNEVTVTLTFEIKVKCLHFCPTYFQEHNLNIKGLPAWYLEHIWIRTKRRVITKLGHCDLDLKFEFKVKIVAFIIYIWYIYALGQGGVSRVPILGHCMWPWLCGTMGLHSISLNTWLFPKSLCIVTNYYIQLPYPLMT